jgi:general secretion pathway protein D
MSNFKKITAVSYLVTMVLALSGCELDPKQAQLPPSVSVSEAAPEADSKKPKNRQPVVDAMNPTKELCPKADQFAPVAPAQHRKIGLKAGLYNLNFDDADLGEFVKVVLSDMLGQNYALSPKVAGKVTLQTAQPLTKGELLPTLEMVLRMNDAVLVKDSKIYRIDPVADTLNTSDISTGGSHLDYTLRQKGLRSYLSERHPQCQKIILKVKQGDNLNGWQLTEIQGDRVILTQGGCQKELLMQEPKIKQLPYKTRKDIFKN